MYYVRIRAEEVGVPPQRSEVNVRVLLKDLNDNAPEFMQQRYLYTLPESVPVGTAVLSVTAQDSDSGINGQFRYYMEDSHFSVNPYTGQISTTKPLDYDQPDSRAHAFVVVAQDSGNPSLNGSARVLVTLNNVNDNAPLFSQSMYYVFVAENADPDEFVATGQWIFFIEISMRRRFLFLITRSLTHTLSTASVFLSLTHTSTHHSLALSVTHPTRTTHPTT